MKPMPSIAGATRMLLSSDGSTTILLEALLHTRLSVHVDRQEVMSARDLDQNIVLALGLIPQNTVVERRSSLLTPDGTVVSINHVVFFNQQTDGWSGAHSDPVPLGKKLRDRHTKQHREILAAGTTEWPGDDHHRTCVYKEYIITCDDDSRIYLLEKFSPDHVLPPIV